MKQLFIYIFSLFLLIPGLGQVYAQDQRTPEVDSADYQMGEVKTDSLTGRHTDTVSIAEDSIILDGDTTVLVKDTTVFTGDSVQTGLIRRIEFYIDYLKFLTFVLPNELKGEAGIAIITRPDLGIHTEFGYGKKIPEDYYTNAEYSVEGIYARLGLQYHYPYNPTTNFMIGAMYGFSSYRDKATYTIESTLWDDYRDVISRDNLQGQWAELVAGSESSYKGSLYLGFQFRFRVLISHDNFSPFEVFAVPGYGRTMDKTVPALNLYIKYLIDF